MGRECSLVQKVFWGTSVLYWLLGMHFFMHNPGGAGLYLPFNAWGWIFASLVMALGLWHVTLSQRLVVSPLLAWVTRPATFMIVYEASSNGTPLSGTPR